MLKDMIESLRPKQWYKNLVIFVCIIFSKNFLDLSMWTTTIQAFIIFCMLSGASYIINDIKDYEKDRMHPKKKTRPIASGKISKTTASIWSLTLLAISLISSYTINIQFFTMSLVFLISNMLYTYILKKITILDILSIAINFIIRAVAGCLAISVFISPWLLLCTFFLALFLALGKRRHELLIMGTNAKTHRKSLENYTLDFVDQLITITTTSIIIAYTLYVILSGNTLLLATIPPAIYGIFRYMMLIHNKNFGGETELIFKDKPIIYSLIIWLIMIIISLYTI